MEAADVACSFRSLGLSAAKCVLPGRHRADRALGLHPPRSSSWSTCSALRLSNTSLCGGVMGRARDASGRASVLMRWASYVVPWEYAWTRGGRMRAARYHRYGPPEELVVEDVAEPHASPGEIRICATAAKPIDCDPQRVARRSRRSRSWRPARGPAGPADMPISPSGGDDARSDALLMVKHRREDDAIADAECDQPRDQRCVRAVERHREAVSGWSRALARRRDRVLGFVARGRHPHGVLWRLRVL